MSRVLVTGGAGTIGAAVMRRLTGDPRIEVRMKDMRSFEVDVQRRWPSVPKARQPLALQACADLREGLAGTVEWLRDQELAALRG